MNPGYKAISCNVDNWSSDVNTLLSYVGQDVAIVPYVMEHWTKILDNDNDVDFMYLDFRKAFDSVPHQCY